MRSERVTLIAEIGLAVALCVALKLLSIRLPINVAGGTISLAMLPIFVVALRRGVGVGVVTGALFGLVDVAIEPYVVHPIQFLLDYPVAYGAAGLSGLGSQRMLTRSSEDETVAAIAGGLGWIAVGSAGCFAAAFTSGIVFFGSAAPAGQPVWLYSALYNASWLVPSALACGVAFTLVMPALAHAVPVAPKNRGSER